MFIAIKKNINGSNQLYLTAYTDGRFSEDTLSKPPYNYKKVYVPDEYVDTIKSSDFNEDLSFNIDKYRSRMQSISAEEEIEKLKDWFNDEYTFKDQKYRRLISLGILDDDGVSADIKLTQLYTEAEINRRKIQELETLITVPREIYTIDEFQKKLKNI